MRIHLIKEKTLRLYAKDKPELSTSVSDWLMKIRWADWNKPSDIKSTFSKSDLLGNGSNRVVFNLKGNDYRLICKYAFGDNCAHVFICWIGTHTEYNVLCKQKLQYHVRFKK